MLSVCSEVKERGLEGREGGKTWELEGGWEAERERRISLVAISSAKRCFPLTRKSSLTERLEADKKGQWRSSYGPGKFPCRNEAAKFNNSRHFSFPTNFEKLNKFSQCLIFQIFPLNQNLKQFSLFLGIYFAAPSQSLPAPMASESVSLTVVAYSPDEHKDRLRAFHKQYFPTLAYSSTIYDHIAMAGAFEEMDRSSMLEIAEVYDMDIPPMENEALVAKIRELRARWDPVLREQMDEIVKRGQ